MAGEGTFAFAARLGDSRLLYDVLSCLQLKKDQTVRVVVSSAGLRLTADHVRVIDATAYIRAALFDEFHWDASVDGGEDEDEDDAQVVFHLNVTVLLHCLNVWSAGGRGTAWNGGGGGGGDLNDFGGGGDATRGAVPLRMYYKGRGTPLVVEMEEDGVSTDCGIQTLEEEDGDALLSDAVFSGTNTAIIMSAHLRDVMNELDRWSGNEVTISMGPDPPHLLFRSVGDAGSVAIQQANDSKVFHEYDCPVRLAFSYPHSLLPALHRTLALAVKTSMRMSGTGVMSFRNLIMSTESSPSYVDFLVCPLTTDGDFGSDDDVEDSR